MDEKFLREIIISVIIETYNNQNNIREVIEQINQVLSKNYPNYEIIIVDNNSKDNTQEEIKALYKNVPHLKVIKLSKTYSSEIAFSAGLDNAIGDFAVLIDPYKADPSNIPTFINNLFLESDIAIGFSNKKRLSFIQKFSKNYLNYEPIQILAINRKVINTLTKIKRKSRNFIFIIGSSIGFSKTRLEYTSSSRKSTLNHNSWTLFTLFDILISNSYKPLRLFTFTGFFISGLYLLFALLTSFSIGFGNFSAFLIFLLFSILTLMSEYLIRILDESRDEPLYYVADEIDKTNVSDKDKFNIV